MPEFDATFGIGQEPISRRHPDRRRILVELFINVDDAEFLRRVGQNPDAWSDQYGALVDQSAVENDAQLRAFADRVVKSGALQRTP